MAFRFFKSVFGPSNYLGVDIGTTSIKIVDVAKHLGKPRLKNYGFLESYGHLERLNNAIQTSSLKMLDKEISNLLGVLLYHLKSRTKDAVASFQPFLAFTTLLEIPEMPAEDTVKTMQFQVRQYIPLPLSEVNIDWIKVGEKENDDGTKVQQILLVALSIEHIRKYQTIFKNAGLNLVALELEGFSIVRSLVAGDAAGAVIVDIGARSTNISVVENGFLKLMSQTDFAGGSLTNALSTSLGVSVRRAEELKKQRGLLGTGGERELSTVITPFLDAIINETKRAKTAYESEHRGRAERVILAGGGANLLGIEKYFEEQISLPVVKSDSFSRVVYSPEIEPLKKELSSLFSVAIGLGIREFV